MSANIPEWVKVGAEVVLCSSGWGRRYGPTLKIAKVYKNGNFVLEGRDGQWRLWSDDSAHQVGSGSRYSRLSCRSLNDDIRAEVAAENALYKAKTIVRAEVERLDVMERSNAHDDIIAEAARIEARQP